MVVQHVDEVEVLLLEVLRAEGALERREIVPEGTDVLVIRTHHRGTRKLRVLHRNVQFRC